MRIFDPPYEVERGQPSLATRSLAIGKRVLLAILALHLTLGLISAHRAWFQVRELSLQLAGSHVQTSVVTSGRTYVDVEVRLIQGKHSEVIGVMEVPRNGEPVYDFRKQRKTMTIALSAEVLRRFAPRPFVVRATAFGYSQWLRVPPPVVREIRGSSMRGRKNVRRVAPLEATIGESSTSRAEGGAINAADRVG
jgi:hypothetical protein